MKHLTRKTVLSLRFCLPPLSGHVASFEKRITVVLPNGLTLMICERPEAPVFSFLLPVDVGSAQDPLRATGSAKYVRAHGIQGHR